jgi:hypothetical protein
MGKALSWRATAFQGAEWRVPTGRRDGAELVGTDGHGSLGELGHGERARGKVELGKKGATGLCCPWSNEQGARARRAGRALGWRLKTTKKRCSQGKRHGREVDELLPCAREKEPWASSSCRGELAAMREKSSSSMLAAVGRTERMMAWGRRRLLVAAGNF